MMSSCALGVPGQVDQTRPGPEAGLAVEAAAAAVADSGGLDPLELAHLDLHGLLPSVTAAGLVADGDERTLEPPTDPSK
jgi:hypothetical protein